LNSSTHSEPGLMTTSTPIQTPTKQIKNKENKENKIMRFSAVVNALSGGGQTGQADIKAKKSQFYSAGQLPSFVFGKIKSLWSAHTTTSSVGLNFLADQAPKGRRSKETSDAAKGTKISKTSSGMDHFSLVFRFRLLFFYCCYYYYLGF
jgi:hypothetical protein